jgi:hypothetical protein
MSNWYKKLTIENSYRDFQMNRPHVDLSGKPLSSEERGFECPPFREKKRLRPLPSPLQGENERGGKGLGVRSHDCGSYN